MVRLQTLQAEKRDNQQKSELRAQRAQGKVPAVVYGENIANTSLYVDETELLKLIREKGSNVLIQLKWDSASTSAMIVDIQTNPLKQSLVHIDFQEVNMKQKTRVEVPIAWLGEEQIQKENAVLQKQVHHIEVETLPTNIPEKITVDVSTLEIGSQVILSDIEAPSGVEYIADPDTVLVSVLPPTLQKDPEEPELVAGEDSPSE
jgi:large subunit ribosomal protein L25